jgi:hypothetical protein
VEGRSLDIPVTAVRALTNLARIVWFEYLQRSEIDVPTVEVL